MKARADAPQEIKTLKHRTDAVTQILRGENIESLAIELGVPQKQIEQWTKEFCRAGEMRLRQMPENFFERCLTSAEKLVPLATLISVLLAVTLFVQGQRKETAQSARIATMERESRIRDAYTALDDKYIDYVKMCLEHPTLDVCDTPIARTVAATPEQKRQESMMLSILMSILERAYLMYNNPNDSFERNQWNAWSVYMKSWCSRDNFRAEWANNKTDFDATFAGYIDGMMASTATSRPAPPER